MYHTQGIFLHFIVINASVHFLGISPFEKPDTKIYLKALNSDFIFHPNWESIGATILLEYREDLKMSRAYVPGDLLYRYKRRMRPHIIKTMRSNFPATSFEWNEMPDATEFEGIQNYQTFGREEDGTWKEEDLPSDRAVFASTKVSDPYSLGNPGGPCKVVQKIDEAPLPLNTKDDLVKDIHKGKDLDNSDASKVYEKEVVPISDGEVFSNLGITNHAQYRMDFRSIPIESVKNALQEFERWFIYRQNNPDKLKPKDRNMLQDLAQGDPVEFSANREGLTIIFTAPRRGKARLVSTWWTGKRNPRPPKPGECERQLQGDTQMSDSLEKISTELMLTSSLFDERTSCGGSCSCGSGGEKEKAFIGDPTGPLFDYAVLDQSQEEGGTCGCEGEKEEEELFEGIELEWEQEHEYEFNVAGDVYIFNGGHGHNDEEWFEFVRDLNNKGSMR